MRNAENNLDDVIRVMYGRGAVLRHIILHRNKHWGNPLFSASSFGHTASGIRIHGSGAGYSAAEARTKAVGELVERYCLAVPLRVLPRADAGGQARAFFEPRDWPTFTDEQYAEPGFPFVRFDADRPRSWVAATSLVTGAMVWTPARLVWVPPPRDDDPFTIPVSTGAACHSDPDRALLNGLYEAVERDAFTIVWEARAVVPLLPEEAAWQKPTVKLLVQYLRRHGCRLLLRDMTTDLAVPAVLAVIHDLSGGRPALAIGAAARSSIDQACHDAAVEAHQTWVWMQDEHSSREISLAEVWSEAERPKAMVNHPLLYSFPEMVGYATHLLTDSIGTVETPSLTEESSTIAAGSELQQVIRKLVRRGFEPLAVDISVDEILRFGLVVKKVLVPGLVPLSIGLWCRHLANPRIVSVPTIMKWPHQRPLSPGAGVPHPLP